MTIEQKTCAAPTYVPYAGASVVSGSVSGTTLVLSFSPALENARTYRLIFGGDVTAVSGQYIEVRGLTGDVNSDGFVNTTDRSLVTGYWSSPGFSCETDINSDGATNAPDRSLVIGFWGSANNCAP